MYPVQLPSPAMASAPANNPTTIAAAKRTFMFTPPETTEVWVEIRMRTEQVNWDSTCRRYSTPFADGWMSAKKKEDVVASSLYFPPKNEAGQFAITFRKSKRSRRCCPEPS